MKTILGIAMRKFNKNDGCSGVLIGFFDSQNFPSIFEFI
jgi:hypothetical protein